MNNNKNLIKLVVKHLTEEELVKNVIEKCKIKNYEFLGIIEFKGVNTKLKLRSKKDLTSWDSTIYRFFINKNNNKLRLKLTEESLIENIKRECEQRNYTFLGINGEFKGNKTKLKLRCEKDLTYWESTDYAHFMTTNSKRGCPTCGRLKTLKSAIITEDKLIENVKEECKRRGGNIEFLEVVEFINVNKTFIKLKCLIHNFEWTNMYSSFMRGSGCPKCITYVSKISEEQMIENIQKECDSRKNVEFLGLVEYKSSNTTYLKLKCLTDGNIWITTTYTRFINEKHGCSKCNTSKLEDKIEKLLKENNINFIPQHRFKELHKQSLDFFLPDYNVAIECQGNQHFKMIKHFGGELEYIKNLERDERKYNICKDKGIKILYYTECKQEIIPTNYHDKIFTNTSDLLNEILENNQ